MIVKNQDILAQPCEPGVHRKVLSYNKSLMMCEISFEKGARGNMHAHPHQQITYVQKGSFLFTIDGKTQEVSAGDSILIEPDLVHGVEALEEAMLVDVFHPMREDFV